MEYCFGAVCKKSLTPYDVIADPYVSTHSVLLLLVPDTYSVWPEAGIFPHVYSYGELIERLEQKVKSKLSAILSPSLAGKARVAIYPSRGFLGGWRFTASPHESILFISYHIARLCVEEGCTKVTLVVDNNIEAIHSSLLLLSLPLVKKLSKARVEVAVTETEPIPYTPRSYISIEVVEPLIQPLDSIIEARDARGKVIAVWSEYELNIIREIIEDYVEKTILHKKTVGGEVIHSLRIRLCPR